MGCEGYPECDQTYPLPQRGDVIGTGEICPQCGSPKVKILGGRRPWILCLDPHCPTKAEYREKQAARALKAAEAGETAEAAKGTRQDCRQESAGDKEGRQARDQGGGVEDGSGESHRQEGCRQEGCRKTTAAKATAVGSRPLPRNPRRRRGRRWP